MQNPAANPARVFGLSPYLKGDSAPLLSLSDGLVVEPELRDHSGRPIVCKLGIESTRPRSAFARIDHVGDRPQVYELAAGQSIDLPFGPFPPYVRQSDLDPGTLTVVAVLTWLDATTSERKVVRSEPLSFDFTAEDIAKRKALEANAFNYSKQSRRAG